MVFLEKTSSVECEALPAPGGAALHTQYNRLKGFLESQFGSESALLLAEPLVDQQAGEIKWYSSAPGPHRRLVTTGGDARNSGEKKLKELVDGLLAYATSRGGLGAEAERFGRQLENALMIPSKDQVWLVGEQPVLCGW